MSNLTNNLTNKKTFKEWSKLFEQDILIEFTTNQEGLLWLKIKSIVRKELISLFTTNNNFKLENTTLKLQFEELFDILAKNLTQSHILLDKFIITEDKKQRSQVDEPALVSQLYRLKHFSWGGNYSNALDKYLVDSYIKVYSNYEQLVSKFDIEISRAVQGYVLCSWYNHSSSILIENIFKSHSTVLPTVGQIKKVDFFVNGIPFDLKVTYLPENYVEQKRKSANQKSELSLLKQVAKQLNIAFDRDQRPDDLYYELTEKVRDKGDTYGLESLKSIDEFRKNLVDELIKNPKELIQNLYEQQGEMRFDASNRLFLVLVDKDKSDDSWKLKRNLDMLKPNIISYLDNFSTKTLDQMTINFTYKNKGEFTAYSDILFITKQSKSTDF